MAEWTCRPCRRTAGWRGGLHLPGPGEIHIQCVLMFALFVFLSPLSAHAQSVQKRIHSGLVFENGDTLEQEVWLHGAQPTETVRVQITSQDLTALNVSPTTLTFTPQNYMERQTVTFTGVDDSVLNDPVNGGARGRRVTIDYEATGGNYEGATNNSWVLVADNEPVPYSVHEGATPHVDVVDHGHSRMFAGHPDSGSLRLHRDEHRSIEIDVDRVGFGHCETGNDDVYREQRAGRRTRPAERYA